MSASIAVEGGIISRTPRLKRPVTSVSYSLPPARTMLNYEIPVNKDTTRAQEITPLRDV